MTGTPVLEVDGQCFSWADVVAGAQLRGEWTALEQSCAAGLAAERSMRAANESAPEAELAELEAQFRYARGLLSADDADAWFEKARVNVREWREFLLRTLLRQRYTAEVEAVADDLDELLWVEGMCSGAFEQFARALAARAAAAARRADGPPPHDAEVLEREYAAFCADATSAELVARELGKRQMDFLRLECDVVAAPGEDVARELALGVTADGRTLAESAMLAGLEAQRANFHIGDTEDAVRPHLLSAARGDLVGPVEIGGGWLLFAVVSKQAPDPADQELAGRVAGELLERAVGQEMDRRVRWLDPALS